MSVETVNKIIHLPLEYRRLGNKPILTLLTSLILLKYLKGSKKSEVTNKNLTNFNLLITFLPQKHNQ